MTKLGIDELRKEFPLLTRSVQSKIKGGIGATCVFNTISSAADQLDMCISMDAVWDSAIDLVMSSRPYLTDTTSAREFINHFGLDEAETARLWLDVFQGLESGSTSEYANGASIAIYTVMDDTGQPVYENGKKLAHAGLVTNSRGSGDELEFYVDGVWVHVDNMIMGHCVVGVKDKYDCDCGGEDEGEQSGNQSGL